MFSTALIVPIALIFSDISLFPNRSYVIATRLEEGELLILVTGHRPQSALADYRLRWGIETLFAALKTRVFNLESAHFRHAERLSTLIALLALVFCWAMLTGLW